MSERDARMSRLALRRHRILSIRALRALGFTAARVSQRVSEGRLTKMHNGVYLVGPPPPSRKGRWLAAVIATGDDAALSHRSSGSLWDLGVSEGARIDVTVPRRGRRSPSGIAVHTTRAFHPEDVAVVDGIRVTSVERTLLDLAEVVNPAQVKRAYERAEKLRILDHRKLRGLVTRSNGRRGLKVLIRLLDYDPTPANETKSALERLLLELVDERGLPPYQRNVLVEGYEIDAYWPEAKLVVELQSYTWHSDRDAFERDHAKLARLRVAGYNVLALTWRQLTEEREWVAAALARMTAVSARSSVGGRV